MDLTQISGYIGVFKQPLQEPDEYAPTMFIASDNMKNELDIILLTPGAYLHAFNYIKEFNPQYVRIFTPSMRLEYVSDVLNLYLTLSNFIPVKIIYPKDNKFRELSFGIRRCMTYMNQFDHSISISYIQNKYVDELYDIKVFTEGEIHYFSSYMDTKDIELFEADTEITLVHVPYLSTMHGGLNYCDLKNMNVQFFSKVIPHSFISIDQYEVFKETITEKQSKLILTDTIIIV